MKSVSLLMCVYITVCSQSYIPITVYQIIYHNSRTFTNTHLWQKRSTNALIRELSTIMAKVGVGVEMFYNGNIFYSPPPRMYGHFSWPTLERAENIRTPSQLHGHAIEYLKMFLQLP